MHQHTPTTPNPLPSTWPRSIPLQMGLLWVWLVLLLSSGLVAPAMAEEESDPVDFERQIVWYEEGTYSLFVPATLIREVPLEELPMTSNHISSLRWMIDNHDRLPIRPMAAEPPECLDPVSPPGPPEPVDPEDLRSWLELATASRLAFVGEVRAVVSGWVTNHYQVGRAVYVEIDRILRDTQGVLEPGAVLPFTLPDGRIAVHGATLCWEIDHFAYQPEPGDSLLFLGAAHSEGKALAVTRLFSITDGVIQTDHRPVRVDQPSKSVDELAKELVAAEA